MSLDHRNIAGVCMYRLDSARGFLFSIMSVGNCLDSEIPEGSECFFDLSTAPRIGDVALLWIPPSGNRAGQMITKRLGARADRDGSDVIVLESDLPAVRLTHQKILGVLVFAYLPREVVRSEHADAVNRENAEFRRQALELMPSAQRAAELARVGGKHFAAAAETRVGTASSAAQRL